MCLYIKSTVIPTEPIKVIKEIWPYWCNSCNKVIYASPFYSKHTWQVGLNRSDRVVFGRDYFNKLTHREISNGIVELGIHFYLANSWPADNVRKRSEFYDVAIIEAEIKPEEFLCYGNNNDVVCSEVNIAELPKAKKVEELRNKDYWTCPSCNFKKAF